MFKSVTLKGTPFAGLLSNPGMKKTIRRNHNFIFDGNPHRSRTLGAATWSVKSAAWSSSCSVVFSRRQASRSVCSACVTRSSAPIEFR